MTYVCPVCGFEELVEEPRDGAGEASFEICESCGFQFGFTDDDLGYSYDQWRAQWIALPPNPFDVLGETLSGVEYRTTDGDTDGADFDVVGMAVTLVFSSSRRLPISWKMDEDDGFLVFNREFQDRDRSQPGEGREATSRWTPLLGRTVTGQASSLLQTRLGLLPWAVRLSLGEGESLVVALGERTPEGPPRYFPDSLIVTSSQAVAKGLVPPHIGRSAWGR